MKRLRIGFDAKRLFLNNTGLGNYSRTVVRNLKEQYPDHEYHLFTPRVEVNATTEYFLDNGFYIHKNEGAMGSAFWRTYTVGKLVDQLNLDLFHGLSHEIPYGVKDTKTVVTFHDLIYEILPSTFPLWDRFFYKRKYKSSAARADHILSISNSTAKDLENLYKIPREKMTTIYQSCNSSFHYDGRPHQGSYLLYVGSINERKGMKTIIQAYHSMDVEERVPCHVIGSGGTYLEECKQLISTFNLTDSFIFHGNISNEQLVDYYDGAIATLLPSMYEGFGIPIIESLFRFTPVITSNLSSLPEATGPGGILIDPGSYQQLANAIAKLCGDKIYREDMAIRGNAFVKKTFDPGVLTSELMSLYQDIAQ